MELESPRWTPRERDGLLRDLRGEVDLLWLTGELRLERPTVDAEIAGACISSARCCSTPCRSC